MEPEWGDKRGGRGEGGVLSHGGSALANNAALPLDNGNAILMVGGGDMMAVARK